MITECRAPPFEIEDNGLLKVGGSTSLLLIEEMRNGQPISQHFGTAFFVRPDILLTAGHCTQGMRGPQLRLTISRPLSVGTINLTEFVNRRTETIECKVISSLYKKDAPHKDISVLHSGTYKSPNFLDLSASPIPLHATVDVIGYPGRHTTQFILGHKEITKPFHETVTAAETLLPAQALTVSRGTVESVGQTISYKVSTCQGMSGSCLWYNGKVFGTISEEGNADNIGVHVGQVDREPNSLPMSVAFTGPDVKRLLRQCNLD
jgi:V8-like Glu-specific endopeptidase